MTFLHSESSTDQNHSPFAFLNTVMGDVQDLLSQSSQGVSSQLSELDDRLANFVAANSSFDSDRNANNAAQSSRASISATTDDPQGVNVSSSSRSPGGSSVSVRAPGVNVSTAVPGGVDVSIPGIFGLNIGF